MKTKRVTAEAAQTQSRQAPQETERPDCPVVYEQEGVYLAVTLPDGWEYTIRTAQDMDQKDDGMQCAIDFWPESSPEAVFSFGYQPQKFGICGTEAAAEPFTLQNGITGTMYTALPGDSFWLTVIYKTAERRDDGGTYLMMASPGADAGVSEGSKVKCGRTYEKKRSCFWWYWLSA